MARHRASSGFVNRDAAVNATLTDSRELTAQYLIWNLLPCQRLHRLGVWKFHDRKLQIAESASALPLRQIVR